MIFTPTLTTSTVLPPKCLHFPLTAVNILHITYRIPHSNEYPSMFWWYPRAKLMTSLQYWWHPPAVLMISPQYYKCSTILNRRPKGVKLLKQALFPWDIFPYSKLISILKWPVHWPILASWEIAGLAPIVFIYLFLVLASTKGKEIQPMTGRRVNHMQR